MFLQVALGGHLLLYNTRTANWFFLRPWPSLVLIGALLATEILAVLMAGFGWLVPQLHWTTIGWAVLYMIAWMFVIGVKHAANKLVDFRDAQAQRSIAIVQAPLLSQAPSPVEPSAGLSRRIDSMDYRKTFVVEPGSKVRLADRSSLHRRASLA